MDAGSIFLICFVVVFSLLLIGGRWFGYPLLMCFARRGTSRRHLCQSPQTRTGVTQDERELPRSRSISATSPSDEQPNHSSRLLPARSITSVFPGTKSPCDVHKATELDILKEPHDLYNMIPVPPLPKRSLGRQVAEVGTQVPPGALLARRSQDTLSSKRGAPSVASGSSSYSGDIGTLAMVTPTRPSLTRTRNISDSTAPSPLRHASLPGSPVDLVPAIPTHLATAVEVKEKAKASVQQNLNGTPADIKNSEDVMDISKPKEGQIDVTEFKINTTNVATKKPCKFHQVGPDQCFEVKNSLPMSLPLRKSPPPQIGAFKAPSSKCSLNAKKRSAGLPFTDSLKRLARRAKATPTDKEASPSVTMTISGPSSYVPTLGSGWSPNEYLTLHNAKPIANPLIEHPKIGPERFKIEEGRKEENDGEDTSMMISHKLRQLDRIHGYESPLKGRNTRRSPPTLER